MDGVSLYLDSIILPKVVPKFHLGVEINLPGFCPHPSAPGQGMAYCGCVLIPTFLLGKNQGFQKSQPALCILLRT